MTFASFWLLRIIQGVIFQRVAVEPVHSFMSSGAVVAPEEKESATVDDAGMSPAFGRMVRLLGLKHPL